MFWRKKKTPEDERQEKARKAVKKIEGPLWGYMVTQRGVVVDILQHLRRVEQAGVAGHKPATMVRIYDPDAAKKEGMMVDSYESLDSNRHLILYEGYYRGPDMADIHIGRMVHGKEKATS